MLTRKFKDCLSAGYTAMALEPTAAMPSYGFMAKHRAHGAFRLTDGLWHYFRYADPVKAAARDAEYNESMLPVRL